MKSTLLILCAVFFLSCNNKPKEEPPKELNLEGTWELVSFLNYREDGTVDTIKSSDAFKQMKMYSHSKVMWSRLLTYDTLDWFGVGDYTYEDGILTEVLDYGSKAMQSRIETKNKFQFEIIIDENHFTQVEKDSLGHPIYAENYLRIE